MSGRRSIGYWPRSARSLSPMISIGWRSGLPLNRPPTIKRASTVIALERAHNIYCHWGVHSGRCIFHCFPQCWLETVTVLCGRHWGGKAGGGTDDDCAASFPTLRAFLRGGGETGPDRGGDDLVCMMSSWVACSVAMVWAICSCLAASCSTLFRITARSRATSSRTNSGEIAAAVSAGAV
jgi:hypothetical protein